MYIRQALLLTLLLLMQTQPLFAEDTAERDADRIFNSVLSPFCPGRMLSDCPSSAAHDLKEKIRTRLKSGTAPSQIEEELYQVYGEEIRGAPRFAAFGIAAWLVPPIVLMLGIGGVWWWLRRTKGDAAPAAAPAIKLDGEALKRLEAVLREED